MRDYVVAIGSIVTDEYIRVDHWPRLSDKTVATKISTELGGMISNYSCNLSTTGVKTYLLQQFADDEYLGIFKEELDKYGVDYSYCKINKNIETTKCIVANTNGERTILIVDGKSEPFVLNDAAIDLLGHSKYVFSTIPYLKNIANNKKIIESFIRKGAKLIIDVEPSTFIDSDDVDFYLTSASILIFNEFGFEEYARHLNQDAYEYVKKSDKIVILTKGFRGVDLLNKGEIISLPSEQVEVVDTTGAGDMFSATFTSGLMNNLTKKEALIAANIAASKHITYMGPKRKI